MSVLSHIIANELLIVPVAAWLTAQMLKTIVQALREKRLDLRYLLSAGGMPSAHASLVCALATTVGIVHGIDSGVFAISAVLAVIVMYDAAGVRQTVDKQSVILNHLLVNFPRTQLEFERLLQQLVGHTRLQVIAGAVLGILLAYWWP